MKWLKPAITLFYFIALTAVAFTGCDVPRPDNTKILIPPSTVAFDAASEFLKTFPGARVFFSQNTGEILWIDGGGKALISGSVQSGADAIQLVVRFLKKHPNLFRIGNAAATLKATGDGFLESPAEHGSLRSFRFEQYHGGLPLQGQYGVALISATGDLLSLQTRLLTDAQLPAPDSPGESAKTLSSHTGPLKPVFNQIVSRTVTVLGTLDGRTYQKLVERVEINGPATIRTLLDENGTILKRTEELPSNIVRPDENWISSGNLVKKEAPDPLGKLVTIPSTQTKNTLVMGFHIDGTTDSTVTVVDSNLHPPKLLAEYLPIATDQSSWNDEAAYPSGLSDATHLIANIHETLRWFRENLGYNSWDGMGAPITAFIRIRGDDTSKPLMGAFGGNGYISVGDAHTSTGNVITDAIDIVAHEFSHSLISARTGFIYQGESGALNEAIADIFGKSVENFATQIIGESIGRNSRNVVHPEDLDKPAKYGDFKIYSDYDAGGVHINAGIMTRALSQVILGDPAKNLTGVGPINFSKFLLEALQEIAFSTGTNLEEFAATLTSYCLARNQIFCKRLENAFTEGELLSLPVTGP